MSVANGFTGAEAQSSELMRIHSSLRDQLALQNNGGDSHRANRIAEELGIQILDSDQPQPPFVLSLTAEGLSLQQSLLPQVSPVSVNFISGRAQYRSGQPELIAKAIGVAKYLPMTVVDATAGLGRDSYVLASKGCDVISIERHPVVHLLLEDGICRALEHAPTQVIAGRMRLLHQDSLEWMKHTAETVDVVYLDPMFPPSRKKAAVKKEMQLFHALMRVEEEGETNHQDLLSAARRLARRRVVVKRPAKATPLANKPADFCVPGRSTRFDVYLTWKNQQDHEM